MYRRVATCKPGRPGLTSFSETLVVFFIQFLSFGKMKAQDRQNGPSGLPEKDWLATRLMYEARQVDTWPFPRKCFVQHPRSRAGTCLRAVVRFKFFFFILFKSENTKLSGFYRFTCFVYTKTITPLSVHT